MVVFRPSVRRSSVHCELMQCKCLSLSLSFSSACEQNPNCLLGRRTIEQYGIIKGEEEKKYCLWAMEWVALIKRSHFLPSGPRSFFWSAKQREEREISTPVFLLSSGLLASVSLDSTCSPNRLGLSAGYCFESLSVSILSLYTEMTLWLLFALVS